LSITNTRCEFWKGKQFLLHQWHQSCCSCWEIDMQSFESLEFRIHQSIPNDNHGILHSWKCHQICFRYALKVNRYSVCGCKQPTVIYRYTVLMSINKYVVGLINTRFYRSTEQHSFAFALTKSSFKSYHILSIALSLPFCLPLQYSVNIYLYT
jgi:hypothetical protein